ncbi:MAG: hypothetical protein KJZ78_08330 [Bryobacteraceae bacterium]|nr:hypothetical protein [Bryobacteraceae bacterium]
MLKRFSAVYRPSDVLAAFSCLPKREFETLRRLTFLTSDDAAAFITEHVPAFVHVIPSTTQHMIEDRSGPPRGKVDWMRTYVRRTQAGNDPTRFVTKSIDRTADTMAARLFTFLLTVIVETAERLDKTSIPEVSRGKLVEQIESGRRHLSLLKGRGVRMGGRITPRDLGPLRKSRRPDVLAAVRLYDLYINVVELAKESLLRNLLQKRQHAPEDMDDLFEVWTLLTLVSLHLNEGWDLEEALLIGGDSSPKRPRFKLTKDARLVEIFYQTVPREMGASSAYKAVFAEYDLDATMRRPDATIQITSPTGEVQRIIVEVKRTRDQRYILDSVYKTFGYLSDFKSTIGPNMPLALMVVWDGIKRVSASPGGSPVIIVNATELPAINLPY